MDRFIARFVAKNPRLVEINLAATQGKISEKDRVRLTAELERTKQRASAPRVAARNIPNFQYNPAYPAPRQDPFPTFGVGGINGSYYY